MSGIVVADFISPIAAWRAWRTKRGFLWSSNHEWSWPVGEPLEAFCAPGSPSAPVLTGLLAGTIMATSVPMQFVAQPSSPQPTSQFVVMQDWLRRHGCESSPLYDADRGEHYVPFGEHSRIVVPSRVAPDPVIPGVHCTCGIYGASNVDEAKQYGEILGRVALWGHVVVHQQGWRAQYGYPTALYGVAEHLREALGRYGVPMLPLDEAIGEPTTAARAVYSWTNIWRTLKA